MPQSKRKAPLDSHGSKPKMRRVTQHHASKEQADRVYSQEDQEYEDDDFGQTLPPLHIYIKRVLDKYPEGGQILKELVQNADDAEAKTVVFLYDKSQHPDRQLWSDTLRDFQGPALYAYNDATFRKEDWKNIQHPEQSGKLEDLTKVGRFGLGFISVYHLTDMPSVVSGNQIGFLDPLEKHFTHDPHTNTRYKGRRDVPEYGITTEAIRPDEHRPGSPIPADIHHLLDQDPYNRFFDGEIVGYERNIDALCTSVDVAAEKIYAKILKQVDEVDETVGLSRRYKIDIGEKDPIIVRVTALYKFLRPKKQPDMHVVLSTGEPTDDVLAAKLEEALPEDYEKQIENEVAEAFTLQPEERRRVLKRLYRKWHPDKNPGQQERANKAFQFLKQVIERHEKGNKSGRSCSDQFSSWESEAKRDREEARRYQERYYQSRHSARSSTSDSYFVPPSFERETSKNPRKAQLWFRQAQEHFQSAELTSKQRPVQSQWIAFQVHQAVETALKAAQYSLDGRPDITTTDLISLARAVCEHCDVTSDRVLEVTLELVSLNCHFSKPRYPQSSHTSGQEYRGFRTHDVLKKCKELLKLTQDIINIRIF
ncbi:sacsin-like isoform X2 [Acanthaster planci]|uniref:Sacsin-like isoform X2 n=1 Tax=Acanthaster planci TaxID=133434 RepID=A0A8B7XHU5_ACAPL|nr:sacsin-like isoform X2 [Acanthaster planci]